MYTAPARSIDFDRSTDPNRLKQEWHTKIKIEVDRYLEARSSDGNRVFPRFLDPLSADATASRDSVSWTGFPRALDAWLSIQNFPARVGMAHRAAEQIARYAFVFFRGEYFRVPFDPTRNFYLIHRKGGGFPVESMFGLGERPQDEYLEWHTVVDKDTGEVRRIDFTSEAPEYWETLAESDPELARTIYSELLQEDVDTADLFFKYDVYCPELRELPNGDLEVVGHVPIRTQNNSQIYREGQYNRNNLWNVERGAIHLTQRANTLFAEINLAAGATQRFAARPDLSAEIDRFSLTACGGYGGVNRNSDPSIGETVNTLALSDLAVMVSDPIGLYIGEVDHTPFRDPDGRPVARDEVLTTVRGKWKDEDPDGLDRVLRFSIHPPDGTGYALDKCTYDGFTLNLGGPIARKTSIVIHGIGMASTVANPLVGCAQTLCTHPDRQPELFTTVDPGNECPMAEASDWRNRLPIPGPDLPSGHMVAEMLASGRARGRA